MAIQQNNPVLQASTPSLCEGVDSAAARKKRQEELAHLTAALRTVQETVGKAKTNAEASTQLTPAQEAALDKFSQLKPEDQTAIATAAANLKAVVQSIEGEKSVSKEDKEKLKNSCADFMYALMKAIANDQMSMSHMQIVDALSTQLAVKIEQSMYSAWYTPYDPAHPGSGGILAKTYGQLQYYIFEDPKTHPTRDADIQSEQALYNEQSAVAQSNVSRQDGEVQGAQGQTSADAQNLQMKAQMAQAVIGIMSVLTNFLGNITA